MKLESHNLKISSKNWKVSKGDKELLESPTGDVWEIIGGDEKGEQLFTWDAAMREAKKQGKRLPTDEEWSELAQTKKDIPNLLLTGYRDTNGTFYYRGVHTGFWSSSESGTSAWLRSLNSGFSTVFRNTDGKSYGLAVRCLEDSSVSFTIKKPTIEIVQNKKVKYSDSETIYSEDRIEIDGIRYKLEEAEKFSKKLRREISRFKKLTF